VSDALIETPPLPWPWWGLLPILTHSFWACSMALFGIEIAGLSLSKAAMWLRAWLVLLVLLVLAAAVGRALAWPDALPWAYGLSGFTALAFAIVFVWQAVRGGSGQHRLVAAAVVLNTLVGLRDFYVFQVLQAYGENTYLRYSSVLFGLTLAFIVALRFGLKGASARYVSRHLGNNPMPASVSLDLIAKVAGRLEKMTKEIMKPRRDKGAVGTKASA
jgi:hypothetical protein